MEPIDSRALSVFSTALRSTHLEMFFEAHNYSMSEKQIRLEFKKEIGANHVFLRR